MRLSRNTVGLMLWLSLWLALLAALLVSFTGLPWILLYLDEQPWSSAETTLIGLVMAFPLLIIIALAATRKRESFRALTIWAAAIWASVGAYVLAVGL